MTERRAFYERIELTDEEIKEAILEGKIKKYFKDKNKPYWEEKENPKTNDVQRMRKS